MPTDRIDTTAAAEQCVDEMGDVFWDYDATRDAVGGYVDPRDVAIKSVAQALDTMKTRIDRGSLCPSVLRSEYASIVAYAGHSDTDDGLVNALITDADWSPEGAEVVLRLAREYGTSMLRNALALAGALDIEDGSRGF